MAQCLLFLGHRVLEELATVDESILWDQLDTPANTYITERGSPGVALARARVIGSYRCMLRWVLSTGSLNQDLLVVLISPTGNRRSLPRVISAEQMTVPLSVCCESTAVGEQDWILAPFFTHLGMRVREATAPTLNDTDWANGYLKVTGKDRQHTLPIPSTSAKTSRLGWNSSIIS